MSSRKDKMISKCIVLLLQFILIISLFQGGLCYPRQASPDGVSHSDDPTIFDSRVLNRVKTLFTRSLQTAKTTSQTGQKKSTITTADVEKPIHLKIDPRQFGNVLLNQANKNAVRKSDIYMNKAIDATALGVAVLKLIFGKDAKMVMKDTNSEDTKASVRAKEPRPKITLWTHSAPDVVQTGDKKSLAQDRTTELKGSDRVGKLSMNILKMVKSLQPSGTTENSETKSVKDSAGSNLDGQDKEKDFSGSESNLERLLSLMEQSKAKEETGNKKSWVLLKVPSQPKDELGMLNDPAATEENSDDEGAQHEHTEKTHKIHGNAGETHTKHSKKQTEKSNSKKNNRGLLKKIQDQVKHLAELVNKHKSKKKESLVETKHRKQPVIGHKQQSYEGKSFAASTRVASTLKAEPFHEVNPVKSDTTAHVNYENSVKNLLEALETSAQNHGSRHVEEGSHKRSRQRKINLVPLKKKEEHASSKDAVGGTNPAGGAVVSLDALRQLGKLLGLSSQHSDDEKRISPYTGTADTLTLATAMPPEALKALQKASSTPTPPTVPPPPPPPPVTPTLNRISEQLKMFAERGLRGHNDYRKLHHAEPLKWSEDLATAAEKLAYQAAKKGTTRRSELVEQKGYGENVVKISNIALENAGEEATRHWYNEKQNFTFSDPVIDEETKAFTQMIWKSTQTLGMGAAKDDDTGELYVVALYNPKGNDQATLRENLTKEGQKHFDVYASIFKKSFAARHP